MKKRRDAEIFRSSVLLPLNFFDICENISVRDFGCQNRSPLSVCVCVVCATNYKSPSDSAHPAPTHSHTQSGFLSSNIESDQISNKGAHEHEMRLSLTLSLPARKFSHVTKLLPMIYLFVIA